YGVFLGEARDVSPGYAPGTVNTDGWQGTRAAWAALVPAVVLLRCFLHGWLKVRDRAKNLGQAFYDLSARVWDAYHAPDKRNFAPWAPATVRSNDGWRSPAERLNRHRYHDNWLQNLLISASLGGYRRAPQNP